MIIKKKESALSEILKHIAELETKGKIKDAIKELEKAIKSGIKDGNLYNRLGDLYIKDNKLKEAIDVYKSGVEIFKEDTYFRNALALCKKILRYDPGNVEICLSIAELLVELDEKSDALIYFCAYIDKQLAQNNEDEVLRGIECIRKLDMLNGKVIEKITEAYKSIGREDLAEKFTEEVAEKEIVLEEIMPSETAPLIQQEEKAAAVEKKTKFEEIKVPNREQIKLNKELSEVAQDVESALSQLRKAMRLDEVIAALEKSLNGLSSEQKKAIALLQKSLSSNLDTLQKSIKEMHEGSGKSIVELKFMLSNFNKTLASLTENQTALNQKISNHLEKINNSFDASAANIFKEIKGILSIYEKTTDDMCSTLNETKNSSVSLVTITDEMKRTVSKMNDSLIKFIIAQEVRYKKQGQYTLIIIGIAAAICALLVLSILK